jgi:hypothetical protein
MRTREHRGRRLHILLTDREARALEELARLEGGTQSSVLRRLLLVEAEHRGAAQSALPRPMARAGT